MVARKLTGVFTFIAVLKAEFMATTLWRPISTRSLQEQRPADEQSTAMDQDVDKTRSVTTSGKQRGAEGPCGAGKFARFAGGRQYRHGPCSWLPVAPGERPTADTQMR